MPDRWKYKEQPGLGNVDAEGLPGTNEYTGQGYNESFSSEEVEGGLQAIKIDKALDFLRVTPRALRINARAKSPKTKRNIISPTPT